MEAIVSDVSGKNINKKQSYKLDILNRADGTHLEIDASFEELRETKVVEAIQLAMQNGRKWYKIRKDKEGNWNREEVEDPAKN